MIPVFRPISNFNKILIVEDDNFAEIVGIASVNGGDRNSYNFKLNFKISVNKDNVDPRNYRKVVITVKKKIVNIPDVNPSVFGLSPLSSETSQIVPQTINSQTLNQNFGLSLPTFSDTLEKRIYSGLQIVSDASRSDNTLVTREINLNFINEELNGTYKNYDVVKDTNSPSPPVPLDDFVKIETNQILPRINKELVDITNPVNDPYYSSLSSDPSFPISVNSIDSYATNVLGLPPRSLYAGMIRYYLEETPRVSGDKSLPRYVIKENLRKAENVPFETTFRVGSDITGETLEVKFDLYKIGNNFPVETVTKDLILSKHISAFESIQKPPHVTATRFNEYDSITVSITDRDTLTKATKFKVYAKNISEIGETSSYELVGETRNLGNPYLRFNPRGRLTVVRVVPVGLDGVESNVYTNVVVGPGYSSIGKLSIVVSRQLSRSKITVYNVPNSGRLELYEKFNEITRLIQSSNISNNNIYEFFVTNRQSGICDYYVKWIGNDGRSNTTNSVGVNHSVPINSSTDVSVKIKNFQKNRLNDDFVVTFKLETSVSRKENETIINALSGSNLKEVYKQLLDASNVSNSAVDSNDRVTPFYADLYFHEVVRTDLNTGERSSFEFIIDGEFKDNQSTRSIRGILPIDPRHSYVYQVFTYKKDPLTLFKNYVKRVVDENGHVYYYSPYKWDNTAINARRTMPETDGSDLPIIGINENLTSTPLGEKAQVSLNGLGEFVTITSVAQERVDRNTIKVFWTSNVDNYSSYYDSFVVLKTVNGRRSFVGSTRLNYIYHELDQSDIGYVYYTIIPVTSEFDIDDAAHSNPFLLSSNGLKDPVLTGITN